MSALEEMRLRAEAAEARIASVSGLTREELAKREFERGLAEGRALPEVERLRELSFKAGFDAGVQHQREAQPPLKAREAKKQRDELLAALKGCVAQMEALAAHFERLGMSRSEIATARAAIAKVEGSR